MITNGNGRNKDDSVKIIDIAEMLAEQDKAIALLGQQSKTREASMKILIGLLCMLTIPAVGAVLEAGRLIERIDDMSGSIRELSRDHEFRLRALEKLR